MALRDHYANGVRLLANICLQKGHDAHIIVFKAFDDGKPRSISRKEWNLLRAELRKKRNSDSACSTCAIF